MGIEHIIQQCQKLYDDLALKRVAEWKAAQPGRKAVGFMPIYVPREIIHAAGILPVGLMGGDMEIIRGDAYFQSYICHIPRSTIELGVSGRLDALDGMVFPSICDVVRNLSGMWQLLFPDKYAKYLDLPQNYVPGIGGKFYTQELRNLLNDMQRLSGVTVTNERLLASIRLYNENRALVEGLYDLRAEQPWRVPTSELYLLLRAGNVLPVEEHTALLQEYRSTVAALDRPKLDNSRIVLTGAFCEQPPLGLIRAIERAGCYIVDDDFVLGSRWLQKAVPETGDGLANLAQTFLDHSVQTASVYIADRPKGEALVTKCRQRHGEGVIFCAASFCDPALLDQPMLATAVEKAAIPYTEFKYAENTGQFQSIKEQTGAFSDSLKLWGAAMTELNMPAAGAPPSDHEAQKERSMILQKEMIADHYRKLEHAHEDGKKLVYTFVPGNLNELIRCFDNLLPVHPEINALQNGMRKRTGKMILDAEKLGHSEDVCTYVKADIGMLRSGNVGPAGTKIPNPDLLLLSYTGCFTFMKWFELLREEYKAPVAMLHTPYQGDGTVTDEGRTYMLRQLKEEVIPQLEKLSGEKFDIDRLREMLKLSRAAEEDLVAVLEMAKHRPSPIDSYFGAVYYVGPIFSAFRGTPGAVEYYRALRQEVEARKAAGQGPITPEGEMGRERYRLVVEGPPNWTSFREFWKMFYDEGAVVVSSTYAKVGGLYDQGFRHDPDHPLETLADYCYGCYTNLSLPTRVNLIAKYVQDYAADGFLINSVKSCNSFSAGQLLMLREVEKRTGIPGGFIESDLVDPRYFSGANIKNRLESYFQMIEQKRKGAA